MVDSQSQQTPLVNTRPRLGVATNLFCLFEFVWERHALKLGLFLENKGAYTALSQLRAPALLLEFLPQLGNFGAVLTPGDCREEQQREQDQRFHGFSLSFSSALARSSSSRAILSSVIDESGAGLTITCR